MDNSSTPKPLGYLRSRIFGTRVFVRALVDPGNLFSTLISEELATKLKLRIQGQIRRVGTAEAGGEVIILGQTFGLRIVLEGDLEPIMLSPFVVRRLAHPLNLGQDFLRQYDCRMEFSNREVSLQLGSRIFPLIGRTAPLLQHSDDPRFSHEFLPGQQVPHDDKSDVIEVFDSGFSSCSNPPSLLSSPSCSSSPSHPVPSTLVRKSTDDSVCSAVSPVSKPSTSPIAPIAPSQQQLRQSRIYNCNIL